MRYLKIYNTNSENFISYNQNNCEKKRDELPCNNYLTNQDMITKYIYLEFYN